MQASKFIKTDQVAEICRVNVPTVNQWIKEGHLKQSPFLTTDLVSVQNFIDFAKTYEVVSLPNEQDPGGNRILIVDDEESVVESIQSVLSSSKADHYVLKVARDGFEAGCMVGKFKPHLMILDIRMPRVNGYEVCHKIKSNPETKNIKVLMVSGFLPEGDQKRAIKNFGADGVLEKPFNREILRQQVQQLLEKEGK